MTSKKFRPLLACDLQWAKLPTLPIYIVQPKIDGVRCMNPAAYGLGCVGRPLLPFKNAYTVERFSSYLYNHIDSEATTGRDTDGEGRLCNETTSVLNRLEGKPGIVRYCFDWLDPLMADSSYMVRYNTLASHLEFSGAPDCHLVPYEIARSIDDIKAIHLRHVQAGYEGSIVRDPDQPHKFGRTTPSGGQLWLIKYFIDSEGVCIGMESAKENTNEATLDARGYTKRSSAKAGKVDKCMIGKLQLRLLKDVFDPITGKKILSKDQVVTVGPGKMTHADRVRYYYDPDALLNQIVKFKFFPRGMKDKPRMPTFDSIRMIEDYDLGAL